MDGTNLKPPTFVLSRKVSGGAVKNITKISDTAQRISANSTRHIRRYSIQNFILIWLDANINESDADYRNVIYNLRRYFNYINTFTNPGTCLDFLAEINDGKVFMIVSDHFLQQFIPLIKQINQIDSIYIVCDQKAEHVLWTKDYSHVKGVFGQIESICDSLKKDIQQREKDMISISILPSTDTSNPESDRLDQSFMYSQLLKEILLQIEQDDDKAKKQFAEFNRIQYSNNEIELVKIDEFERNYHLYSPIWWYTKEPFIYEVLNRALRTQDTTILIKMGFFLRDLHRQIERLHAESMENRESMTIYRGQGMLKSDLEKITNSKGGLLSFNNFLSTTKNPEVSRLFAESANDDPNLTGVLFQMEVDQELASTPFASIEKISYYSNDEQEILFSMHAVFRIGEMKQIDDGIWQVSLIMTKNNDQQLNQLTQSFREEIGDGTGWARLGSLLIRMGELHHAEEVYKKLLDSTVKNDSEEAACIIHQFGYIDQEKGDYASALSFYQKALEIKQKYFPPDHPDLATSYNNIGQVHESMGEYHSALSFYQMTLDISEKSLAPNHLNLAATYNNIAGVHQAMGKHSNALSFYQKSLEIKEKALPSNHPDLASTYNNIGGVYQAMKDNSNALSFYQKALEIFEKSLPSNHPSLAAIYNNIGIAHQHMRSYSIALSFYQKALEIEQKCLLSNHPLLATSYTNIGAVHKAMGDYSDALSFYQKALEIFEKPLLQNHPSLAITYNSIGAVYQEMRNYSSAISFYQKALEIQQKYISSNHQLLSSTYNNIGLVHRAMGDYSSALSYVQKALEIQQHCLPPNHPDLAITYNNIGLVHREMEKYLSALSFYQKTLEIQEKSLHPDHPDLALTYNNIAGVHQAMGEYSSALSFYQKTLKIQEKSLPPNHSPLAITYNNIGAVHQDMGNYSTALSFYQRALEIQQKSLPFDHPSLATTYNNIGLVHREMRDYSSARSFCQKTLKIQEESHSPNQPLLLSKKKRCHQEPLRVLAKILNLFRFRSNVMNLSMVLDNLQNHAR